MKKSNNMDINLFLEDFNNEELSEDAWWEQMREAVEAYNGEFSTIHQTKKAILGYKMWKWKKNSDFNEQ